MKHFLSVFIFCSLVMTLSAQESARNVWRPLFGKDLSKATYDPEAWSETNGMLTAMKDEAIWTNEEYKNFELDLEFKTDPGTNSGVIIYCTDTENWIPNSVEVQIADDHYEKWADAKPYERCGAIYGHLGPHQENVVKKPGEWNHMRIRCTGQRISVILNGKKVNEMNMSKWTSGTENPDGSEIPAWLPTPYAELPTKGFIGLQGKHGDATVWFKNIKIRSTVKSIPVETGPEGEEIEHEQYTIIED